MIGDIISNNNKNLTSFVGMNGFSIWNFSHNNNNEIYNSKLIGNDNNLKRMDKTIYPIAAYKTDGDWLDNNTFIATDSIGTMTFYSL